jgi:hypothetical protein
VRQELAKKGSHIGTYIVPYTRPSHNNNLYNKIAGYAAEDDEDIEQTLSSQSQGRRVSITRFGSDKNAVRPVTVVSSNGDSKTFALPPAIKLEKEPLLGKKQANGGWKPKSRYSGYGSS